MAHFVLGDQHLSHEAIIRYCDRPFENIDEMNYTLIQNWNNVVTSVDTVYVLGDVTFHKKHLPMLNDMNGRKILVPGNHDKCTAKEYLKYFDDIRGYIVKDNIILSHIPIRITPEERFAGNIHAHFHNARVLDNGEIHPFYYCVSVEQINYTPILLEEAINNLKNQK